MTILDATGAVLLVLGAALAFVAGVGLWRFPDVFARMHAATKPATLGLVLIGIGAIFVVGSVSETLTVGLVIALQFLTAPAGAHMVGRAAAGAGIAREHLVIDDHPHESS